MNNLNFQGVSENAKQMLGKFYVLKKQKPHDEKYLCKKKEFAEKKM